MIKRVLGGPTIAAHSYAQPFPGWLRDFFRVRNFLFHTVCLAACSSVSDQSGKRVVAGGLRQRGCVKHYTKGVERLSDSTEQHHPPAAGTVSGNTRSERHYDSTQRV